MLRAVVAEIMEPPERVLIPPSDVNPLRISEKSRSSHVVSHCPARRAVNVLCVLGKFAGPLDIQRVNESQRGARAYNHQERTQEDRLTHLRIARTPVLPDPPSPLER